MDYCDRVAWPTLSPEGLCVTHYAPAADFLVHPLVPPDLIDKGNHTGAVQLKVGTVNLLTAADGPRGMPAHHMSGRIEFLCLQAVKLKYSCLGIQESTAKDVSYMCDSILRLVGGRCPSRNKRVECWLNLDLPYFVDGKLQQRFCKEDATVVAQGIGFIVVRVASQFCSCDFVVGHAPHSARPPQERSAFWSSLSDALDRRKGATDFHLFLLLDANAEVGSIVSSHIGDRAARKENDNGFYLHWFLRRFAVFLFRRLLIVTMPEMM